MRCPRCASIKTRVVDSREGIDGRSVRRRRECESCEFRFTTFERLEEMLPLVVKKDGRREPFDRDKLLGGLKKACQKRPVSIETLEEIIRRIEAQVIEGGEKEIPTRTLGEYAIEQLREVDEVAYVRFASVYREFSDLSEFIETLRSLGFDAASVKKRRRSEDAVKSVEPRVSEPTPEI